MNTKTSSLLFTLATISCVSFTVSQAQVLSTCHPVANTPQPEFAVSSASDGTNFLIGICAQTGSADIVGAQLLSPAGSRVGNFINSGHTMAGFADAPRVAFGAGNYLMVWTDAASHHPASGNDIFAQFVSPTGNLVGNAFPVSGATGDQSARGAAFDGENFLVIWTGEDGLRGRRLSPAGQLQGVELLFTTEDAQEAAAVAYGGGKYFVTWVEGTDGAHAAKGRLVSALGELGEVLLLSQTNSHFYNPISVAFGEDRFMVAWHHNAEEDADWDLRGRMVRPDGTMPGGELVLAQEAVEEFAWANNVVFDGEDFLLVWAQAENPLSTNGVVLGQYWTRNGTAKDRPFVIDSTPRAKFGLGLSKGNGQLLVLFDMDLLAATADVCARTVYRPTVAITPFGSHNVQVIFTGVLQYSSDLTHWMDYSPQPVSPWTTPATQAAMFFRAR